MPQTKKKPKPKTDPVLIELACKLGLLPQNLPRDEPLNSVHGYRWIGIPRIKKLAEANEIFKRSSQASWQYVVTRCGRPGCLCATDPQKKHGPYLVLRYRVRSDKPWKRFHLGPADLTWAGTTNLDEAWKAALA